MFKGKIIVAGTAVGAMLAATTIMGGVSTAEAQMWKRYCSNPWQCAKKAYNPFQRLGDPQRGFAWRDYRFRQRYPGTYRRVRRYLHNYNSYRHIRRRPRVSTVIVIHYLALGVTAIAILVAEDSQANSWIFDQHFYT